MDSEDPDEKLDRETDDIFEGTLDIDAMLLADPQRAEREQQECERKRELREALARQDQSGMLFAYLPRGDHGGRAEQLIAAITGDPQQNLELAAHAAVAEAALAVADELAKLHQLLTEKLPDRSGD